MPIDKEELEAHYRKAHPELAEQPPSSLHLTIEQLQTLGILVERYGTCPSSSARGGNDTVREGLKVLGISGNTNPFVLINHLLFSILMEVSKK